MFFLYLVTIDIFVNNILLGQNKRGLIVIPFFYVNSLFQFLRSSDCFRHYRKTQKVVAI